MKKFTALILTLVSVLFFLTSCTGSVLNLDNRYYQSTLINDTYINETCVYNVAVTSKTPSNSTEYVNEHASLKIDEGTFTTNLRNLNEEEQSKYGDGYVYTTKLVIKGKYLIGNEEFIVDDEVTSTTYFKKFHLLFAPYYSEKHVKSTTLTASDKYYATKYEYKYNVKYDDKAVAEVEVLSDQSNHISHLKGKSEYPKYNEGAFVENEILLFVPRTFDLTESYLQNAKTLDVVSRKLQPIKFTTAEADNGGISNKTIQLPTYVYNGVATENKDVIATKLSIELTDVFKGAEIEAYYASDHAEMRHALVQFYTKMNSDLGYLQYTLKEVNFTEN